MSGHCAAHATSLSTCFQGSRSGSSHPVAGSHVRCALEVHLGTSRHNPEERGSCPLPSLGQPSTSWRWGFKAKCPSLPHPPWWKIWASLVAQLVKNLPAVRETWILPLGWEDPLERGKATYSGRKFHGPYSPWGHKELDMTE